MPVFKRPDVEIHYEVHGSGFPLLIFAPGGLRSQLDYWRRSPSNPDQPPAWMNPMQALAPHFTVVGMDQRNAGQSRAGVHADDGWHSFAEDHLALMDHLGFDRFHVMGGCIGGTFCLTLCERAPQRITAAVLQNPIGFDDNKATWDAAVSGYAATVRGRDPSITEETVASFGRNMFDHDFVFSVSRDFVRQCRTPLLLQPGNDTPHPRKTSDEIASLAPNIEVQENWKGPEHLQDSIRRVTTFLLKHTPQQAQRRTA